MGTACALWVGGDEAANMEEAVACYRRVLEVWTREAAPLEWTTTQLNLAFALRRQASSDAAANMEEALACYRNALEIVTRGYDAQLWAKVQFSMGTAYAERVYGDKAANWEEAVACYRRALEVRTREEIPQLWANTTWRMVIALQGAEHWVEALESPRSAGLRVRVEQVGRDGSLSRHPGGAAGTRGCATIQLAYRQRSSTWR